MCKQGFSAFEFIIKKCVEKESELGKIIGRVYLPAVENGEIIWKKYEIRVYSLEEHFGNIEAVFIGEDGELKTENGILRIETDLFEIQIQTTMEDEDDELFAAITDGEIEYEEAEALAEENLQWLIINMWMTEK